MAEQKSALDAGRDVVARLNPPLESALAEKYDTMVPGFAESLVEWAYGRHYARPNLDLKTRQLCTISALTVLGGQPHRSLRSISDTALPPGQRAKKSSKQSGRWRFMAVFLPRSTA